MPDSMPASAQPEQSAPSTGPAISVLATGLCIPDAELAAELGFGELTDAIGIDASILPAMVRRRTSIATRVAVSAASRASNGVAPSDGQPHHTPAIFVSSLGEMQVTDRLCSAIARQDYPLSPTLFHNSVHNTAAGYWSMATGNRSAMQAMGALQDSFALGLLEAWCQLQTITERLLLVVYDESIPPQLLPNYRWQACGFALMLGRTGASSDVPQTPLLRCPTQKAPPTPPIPDSVLDNEFPLTNPALAALALIRALRSETVPAANTPAPVLSDTAEQPAPRKQTVMLSAGLRPWSVTLQMP